jgi:hypothetical protein
MLPALPQALISMERADLAGIASLNFPYDFPDYFTAICA